MYTIMQEIYYVRIFIYAKYVEKNRDVPKRKKKNPKKQIEKEM